MKQKNILPPGRKKKLRKAIAEGKRGGGFRQKGDAVTEPFTDTDKGRMEDIAREAEKVEKPRTSSKRPASKKKRVKKSKPRIKKKVMLTLPQQKLVDGIHFIDLDKVKEAVGEGAMVNGPTKNEGITPLMEASSTVQPWRNKEDCIMSWGFDRSNIARYLIEEGADVNATDSKGETALMWAAYAKDSERMVKLLLEKGADPNLRTKDSTALMRAAAGGNIESVKMLLQAGAFVDATDENGKTALQIAIAGKKSVQIGIYVKIEKILRDAGATE